MTMASSRGRRQERRGEKTNGCDVARNRTDPSRGERSERRPKHISGRGGSMFPAFDAAAT